MKFASGLKWASAAVLLIASAGLAHAGMPLVVQMDQSQLLELPADPGTIIVGNPSIADVSLNGRQLFVHGHSFGETNLMIFDGKGQKIADFEVTVSHDTQNQLSLYMGNNTNGPTRYTYSCAPNCEQNMMVGDNNTYLQQTLTGNASKLGFATGTKSAGGGGGDASGGSAGAQ
ncbi:pilus assembly protein N-terminal domain-containing protein [Aestuariivirga litoralis]|uniref:pilus assembly protein N-terminal domain-containing protein n=1 Tax=Aestuariivirga litoralis TaxID=2650924 RepID=UPI0018C82A11|nr:pilus assembly protein N-terminal domain-containing protein [Aestuariivirga litoralis]MBG1233951.1 hypothetical protein [Aestuariivirga litoralis]